MKFKIFAALAVACAALMLYADLPMDDDLPAKKTSTPEIISHEPAKALATTFVERVVTITDPSTMTYPVCSGCTHKIPSGRHYILMQDGRQFCSQTCFNKALPQCEVCGTKFMNGFVKDSHYLCSQACIEATWPKCQAPGCGIRSKVWKVMPENNEVYCLTCWNYPRCHSCMRPDRLAEDLKDGRYLCRPCRGKAVFDTREAQKLVLEVRNLIISKLDIPVETKGVVLYLVDPSGLRKVTRLPGVEQGVLVRKDVVKNVEVDEKAADGTISRVRVPQATTTYEMHIINKLSKEKFMEVAAHQLAVLWLELNYPNIGDLAAKEGFGEWVASQVNELYGRPEMNVRMEVNQNPYYGGGYRRVKQQIEQKGFEDFKKYLEALSNP